MATLRQPWPRAAQAARKNSVNSALEILTVMRPMLRSDRYRNDPALMGMIAEVSYLARDIIDQLTAIPAVDEIKRRPE